MPSKLASPSPARSSKPRDIIKGRTGEFFPELQRRFGTMDVKPKHIGDGGAGVVYQVTADKVVKVMLGRTKHKRVEEYKRMFKQMVSLTNASVRKRLYEHFYVHSAFHTSRILDPTTKTPAFVYELMEYMPMDLKGFSRLNRWTGDEFKSILCQVMHGLHLFHRLHYVVTDLKVDNVLVNPLTGRIKLNDFCESYNRQTRSACMYTYRNFAHAHSPQEDVWRLGILILEFLQPRVNALVARHGLVPPEKDFIRSIRGKLKLKQPYVYASMIEPYVHYQQRVLVAHDPDKALWSRLFPLVERLLRDEAHKRPTLRSIVTNDVFCSACFIPRTEYGDTFGDRYVQ